MTHRHLTVAAIPERHAYVRHIASWREQEFRVLLDPANRPWWPPHRLDPRWIEAHADQFDVYHVHFGFDAADPERLHDVCRVLRRHGKPLVYTAHDLRNPHQVNRGIHDRQIAVWLEHADAVLTLTHGAAEELRRRFGVAAAVLAHPHVVPLEQMAERVARRAAVRRSSRPRVGLHLKSLRPNMAAVEVLSTLGRLAEYEPCEVVVDVHHDVVDPGGINHDSTVVELLRRLSNDGTITVRVHDYFDNDEFFDYLATLHVSVLPYRYGTHSGWLEACRDLGVAVVAPDCGYYAEQGATASFTCNEIGGLVPETLLRAVAAALRDRASPVGVDARRIQREEIAAFHAALYRRLLADTSRHATVSAR
ncbi:hypothetical protein BH23ACT10_BH23ACT10_11370 [soil metagenome]